MPATILIVDDEADLAETCARLLKREGYECLVAYGVEDAIALFDARHPTLVLSDIALPTRDGFEIARHVQQHAPGIPVILMTAYDSANSVDEAKKAGAAGYLRKPFANAELVAMVKSSIGHNG